MAEMYFAGSCGSLWFRFFSVKIFFKRITLKAQLVENCSDIDKWKAHCSTSPVIGNIRLVWELLPCQFCHLHVAACHARTESGSVGTTLERCDSPLRAAGYSGWRASETSQNSTRPGWLGWHAAIRRIKWRRKQRNKLSRHCRRAPTHSLRDRDIAVLDQEVLRRHPKQQWGSSPANR